LGALLRDIDGDLKQWAIWHKCDAMPRLSYPHKAAFAMGSSRGYTISDELAESIDKAVSGLKFSYPKEHEAIVLIYLDGLKGWQAAERMRCHHRTLSQYLDGGRRFIDGAIYGKFCA
jgi:DNA-directed RNA polymerase specialized sigma24 family protein